MSVLAVSQLTVAYGAAVVLHELSLEVREGEIVTVIGANGAGKTTLLKTIAGVLRPASGRILLDGADIGGRPSYRVARRGVVLVPEGRGIFGDQSVRDNLLLGAYLRHDRAGIARDLDFVFGVFPVLRERKLQDATTLSGGEQQMCALGRGIMSKPKLLMIDELSLGLAPQAVERMSEALREINRAGITILLVEQDVATAFDLAHHAFVIEQGKVAIHGEARALAADPKIRQAYMGI